MINIEFLTHRMMRFVRKSVFSVAEPVESKIDCSNRLKIHF